MESSSIGLIGLAVMGENLVLNMESKGFSVSVFNRSTGKVDAFLQNRAKGKRITGTYTLKELVGSLERPRKVMMMVKAGQPVDELIDQLVPLLDPGDIIIDGGNSHFPDTTRRTLYVESKGLLYIGTGVSGGEEGALLGPSIMPGGSKKAWPLVRPILQTIAAKIEDGSPCCEWIGEEGAGHFVKMVHNGIEYGDMQLICETYQVMKDLLGMTPDDMSRLFEDWNQGELHSYLIGITADILHHKDSDGTPLVDRILDTAGQKGTGQWTVQAALNLGIPLTLISEAVFARSLSAMKEERVNASKTLLLHASRITRHASLSIDDLRHALYATKIISYAQGYMLMQAGAREYGWNLNPGAIARVWRGGCIIRSAFLGKIEEAFSRNPDLKNLLLDPYFAGIVNEAQDPLRKVISEAILQGIPVPAFTAALNFFDGYRSERLPANLLQAQRDYFGAHTYERVDRERGEFFHTQWKQG